MLRKILPKPLSSSKNILKNILSSAPQVSILSQASISKLPTTKLVRQYSAIIRERMYQKRSEEEKLLKKECEQLLLRHGIKENYWVHDYSISNGILKYSHIYYLNKTRVLHELLKIDDLNQKSFDKLSPKNIECIANILELLEEMQLYNLDNVKFIFSLNCYEKLELVLKSFKIRHELFDDDYSFDTLKKRFEFIKKNPEAIIGMGLLARTIMEWQDIVYLLQENGARLFNDKAFIAHLVYNSNKTLNIDIGENRKVIQEALNFLNHETEIISAVVAELKSDTHQYQFIKNDIIPILVNLAKKSQLPSQLEQLQMENEDRVISYSRR